jgi:hypothetical protein
MANNMVLTYLHFRILKFPLKFQVCLETSLAIDLHLDTSTNHTVMARNTKYTVFGYTFYKWDYISDFLLVRGHNCS